MTPLLLSPLQLTLTLATYTIALPICALSLTVTQVFGLETNAERSLRTNSNSGRGGGLKVQAAAAAGTKGGASTRGTTMERRLSSTNSALIPVPEEQEQDEEGEGEVEEEGFVTCEEEEEGENLDMVDDSYSLTPRLLVDLFALDVPGNDELVGPPSPSFFSSIDQTLPSLLSEPMPFSFNTPSPDPGSSSSFGDSPTLGGSISTASSSPVIATPGDSPTSPLSHITTTKPITKLPRPASPDPRQQGSKKYPSSASSSSRRSLALAQNAAHHQQVIHGLPNAHRERMGMGGGTFETSQGTPLRGLGLMHAGLEGGAGKGGEVSFRSFVLALVGLCERVAWELDGEREREEERADSIVVWVGGDEQRK